jgi:hypothetical protein
MAGKESIVSLSPGRYFNVAHASDYTATTPSWIEERLRSGVLPYRWAGDAAARPRCADAVIQSLLCRAGGTGRRAGLKIRWPQGRVGSIPMPGTNFYPFLIVAHNSRKHGRRWQT